MLIRIVGIVWVLVVILAVAGVVYVIAAAKDPSGRTRPPDEE